MKVFIMALLISFNSYAALDESVCANLVKTELEKINSSASKPYVLQYWTAICKGILDHIKQAAQVSNTGSCNITGGSSTGTWGTTSTGTIQ